MIDILSLLRQAGVAVGSMGQARPDMPRRIWDELSPWLVRFASNSAEKWLPTLLRGEPCSVPRMRDGAPIPCDNHAIAKCDCCSKPVCIHHARVDQHADAICYLCVVSTMHAKRGTTPGAGVHEGPKEAPPIPKDMVRELVNKSLRVLKVKRGASWEEVKRSHRKLSAEHHPDRVQGDKAKAQAEEAFKKVQVAFQDLERHYKSEVEKAA